jgi:hypothetical protein
MKKRGRRAGGGREKGMIKCSSQSDCFNFGYTPHISTLAVTILTINSSNLLSYLHIWLCCVHTVEQSLRSHPFHGQLAISYVAVIIMTVDVPCKTKIANLQNIIVTH